MMFVKEVKIGVPKVIESMKDSEKVETAQNGNDNINNSDNAYVVNVPELRQACFTDLISEKSFKSYDMVVDRKWGLVLKKCE